MAKSPEEFARKVLSGSSCWSCANRATRACLVAGSWHAYCAQHPPRYFVRMDIPLVETEAGKDA